MKSLKHDVIVVATLGDAGAEACFRGQRFFCEANQVNVVDRTGGGDAFDAGFLDAWLDRRDVDACLERGLPLDRSGRSIGATHECHLRRRACPETGTS